MSEGPQIDERDETCLNNAIHESHIRCLQHMQGTASDGGISSLSESSPHNLSSEAIVLCYPLVKIGGTLIERFLFHAGLVLFPRNSICFADLFLLQSS